MSPQRLGGPCGRKLGYKNVYRDPYGFPKWQEHGAAHRRHSRGMAGLPGRRTEPGRDRSLQGWAMLWTLLGVFAGGLA
jgi:thioredoxin:protein disulfide reductase